MEKWMMIVNPASASAMTHETWQESRKLLTDGGLEIEAVCTEYSGHAIHLAFDAAGRGFSKFIAAGGDGTVHEVMTGLLRHAELSGERLDRFTLAVLPYGTGNDWIKTARVPKEMDAAARCILAGRTEREDVVRVAFGQKVFCMANIGGIGLDANICYYTNRLKVNGYKGALLYKLVAPYSLFTKHLYPVEIVCDGKVFYTGPMFSAVIGNGIYRGGGVRQNEPGGSWSDGRLELSVMGNVTHIGAFRLMLHALKGDFAEQKGIHTTRFRSMAIRPLGDKTHRVELDGEIPGRIPMTVELTGQQIQIIVP